MNNNNFLKKASDNLPNFNISIDVEPFDKDSNMVNKNLEFIVANFTDSVRVSPKKKINDKRYHPYNNYHLQTSVKNKFNPLNVESNCINVKHNRLVISL